uniref:Uncharacterized protein LOC113790167 isoform X1 n=1 Tax=Dermatophagoides pteronyssinus TaxID=6956 RepID=A0A6P6XUL0_DERPT|nr:uncharacterized protein LOC113790167 isoform X1 [Dermatophagoides pteronyssinus]
MSGEPQEVFFDHEGQSAVFLELGGSRCAILINISRQMPYNRFWYLQFPNSDDFMYLLRRLFPESLNQTFINVIAPEWLEEFADNVKIGNNHIYDHIFIYTKIMMIYLKIADTLQDLIDDDSASLSAVGRIQTMVILFQPEVQSIVIRYSN